VGAEVAGKRRDFLELPLFSRKEQARPARRYFPRSNCIAAYLQRFIFMEINPERVLARALINRPANRYAENIPKRTRDRAPGIFVSRDDGDGDFSLSREIRPLFVSRAEQARLSAAKD